jgi:hypothetical protein
LATGNTYSHLSNLLDCQFSQLPIRSSSAKVADMKRYALLLLFAASSLALAQVQPNPIPGLGGVGLEEGLDAAGGNLVTIMVFKGGQQIQSLPVCTGSPVVRQGSVGSLNTTDLNFDGLPDLLLQISKTFDNETYCVWLWNPSTQQYVASPALSQLTNPRAHPANKTISSFTNISCPPFQGCHDTKTYVWSKGQLKLVKDESLTLAQNLPVSGPGCDYILSVQELKKGKMVLVSSDRVNSQGAKICFE